MIEQPCRPDMAEAPTRRRRAPRWRKAVPLIGVLALGLMLSACDKCGDFFWHRQPGSCHAAPDPR
jgi:hypothetical protein